MNLERPHGRVAVAVGLDRVAMAGQGPRVVLADCRLALDNRYLPFHRRIIAHGGNLIEDGAAKSAPSFATIAARFARFAPRRIGNRTGHWSRKPKPRREPWRHQSGTSIAALGGPGDLPGGRAGKRGGRSTAKRRSTGWRSDYCSPHGTHPTTPRRGGSGRRLCVAIQPSPCGRRRIFAQRSAPPRRAESAGIHESVNIL